MTDGVQKEGMSHRSQSNEHLDFLRKNCLNELLGIGADPSKAVVLAEKYALEKDGLEQLAIKDRSTGAYSKAYLQEVLPKEIAMEVEAHGHNLAIIMCDMDYLKRVNDEEPDHHSAGDRALIELVKIFRETCEDPKLGTVIARVGGEEFCLVVPHQNEFNTIALATKIRASVETDLAKRAGLVRDKVTLSLGCYVVQKGDTAEKAIKSADDALYKSKETRNMVSICEPDGAIKEI